MKIKRILISVLAAVLILSLASCATETTITIGDDGYWYINGEKTDKYAVGADGENGEDGQKGEPGDIAKVESCEKTGSTATKDNYKITFTDGTTSTFSVAKGADGESTTPENILDSNGNIYNFDKLLNSVGIPGMKYAKADIVTPDARFVIEDSDNSIKDNKHLTFTADIKSLAKEGGKILIGHGYNVSNGSWIEITATTIKACSYYSYGGENNGPRTVEFHEEEHGLDISGYITVNLDVNDSAFYMSIFTPSGSYSVKPRGGWTGQMGDIFAAVEEGTLENAELRWFTDDYAKKIWIIGDSYLGISNGSRWPYYLYQNGYDNALLMGYAGMGCTAGVKYFSDALNYGTPTYAVWCLGMNNGDKDDTVNPVYMETVNQFLALCEEHNIIPILTTTPNTPKVCNYYKNDWVKKLCNKKGYRYVDFAKAVGAEQIGSDWYDEMLYIPDQVHPDTLGAQALYFQFIKDFPEILIDNKR